MMNIKIFDETLRDGEQQVGVFFSSESKRSLADLIRSAGVDYIDIMLGVHSSEDQLIKELARTDNPITPACMIGKEYADKAIELGVNRVIMFYSVSDILLGVKGKTRQQALEEVEESVKYAYEKGLKIDFAAEDASRADFEYLVAFGKRLKPYIDHFVICDTVGCLQPNLSRKIVQDFIRETGCKVGLHYHNDLGLAVENTIQGILAGAELISGTFTGIGERAGNVPLEQVLLELKKLDITAPDFDYSRLDEICRKVRELGGAGPAEPMSEQTRFVETGIHVSALRKNPQAYSIFPDYKPILWFGKYSGSANYAWLFADNGIDATQDEIAGIREKIKEKALQEARSFSGDEIMKMYRGGELKWALIILQQYAEIELEKK